jgi:YgiT-type zinc finger domain-containing protein
MRCPECRGRMAEKKEEMEFKANPKIIVEKVKVSRCSKCGFSSISEHEYERVRKKIEGIKAPKTATVIL